MPSEDISRSAFYASKRYRGVRMQQGRVLTDDDWNSEDDIASDDLRWTRVHVIGPAGSPDDGFKLLTPIVSGTELDFELAAGTYYVSGHRVTLSEPIHFAHQPDWLDMPTSERLAPTAPRTDFAYLEVWEQIVTAVEDEELLEKALGGPDTTTRRRLMARVRLLTGVTAEDCEAAFDELATALASEQLGTLDASGELVNDLTLHVSYAYSGAPGDLCTPASTGGYLGAENQAIRVQLMHGQMVWGYDDAAPPYRATIDATGSVLTFLSQPRDAAHWPLAGQTIEVLRPVAELANGEHLADVKGHLSKLGASYDPMTKQVTLLSPHPDAAVLTGLSHVYVRVWRRGTDLASAASQPVVAGTPMALGNTGVTVTFEGTQLGADAYWVIAVRPETPDQVVPWELETGRRPHGIRRFYAPLGMFEWTLGPQGQPSATVEDCRPTFPPLTAQRGCCRYTVGDGVTSHGQFQHIQDAIDALPAAGGEICLLAGNWEENVVLAGKSDVKIHGCGPRSVVRARDVSAPTFLLSDSARIRFEHFSIVNREFLGVLVMPPAKGQRAEQLTFFELDFVARDRAALVALGVSGFTLERCRIQVERLEAELGTGDVGAWPAVFLVVRGGRVEQNLIDTARGVARTNAHGRTALGGLQLGGQTQRVLVRDNVIRGGLGNGITLGSVRWSAPPVIELASRLRTLGVAASRNANDLRYVAPESAFAARRTANALDWASLGIRFVPPYTLIDCCPDLDPTPPGPNGDDGNPLVPTSAGNLRDIRIDDNEISGMGSNGIGVAHWWTLQDAFFDMIRVERLDITRNRIRDCLELGLSRTATGGTLRGYGGIALASSSELVIWDNQIEGNGATHADPSCGVFLLMTEHLTFERNLLRDNGRALTLNDALKAGYRGGLVAVIVEAALLPLGGGEKVVRDDDRAAAKLADNRVFSPDGPALLLNAVGSVSVGGNQLVVIGREVSVAEALAKVNGSDPAAPYNAYFFGQSAHIFNLGITTELGDALSPWVGWSGSALEAERIFSDGQLLFQHNQVRLDLRAPAVSRVISSVGLLGLDDIGVEGNQLTIDSAGAEGDQTIANLVTIGVSARVNDNRMKERLGTAAASAYTLGLMNNTSDNQGTHCFLVVGLAAARTASPNHSFSDVLNAELCRRVESLAEAASKELETRRARGDTLFGAEPPASGAAATKRPVVARDVQYTLGLLE